MKIREMEISARAKSCLLRAGYTDSSEIEGLSDESLLEIKNLNQGCVDEIRKAVSANSNQGSDEVCVRKNSSLFDNAAIKMPISKWGLSLRSYNCLRRDGIDIVRDVFLLSSEDMMKIRNLGRKGLEEILGKIRELGGNLRSIDEDDSLYGYPEYTKEIAKEKPDCWEHRLYIEMMILNYGWLSEFRKEEAVLWENDHDDTMIDDISGLKTFLLQMLKDLKDYTLEMAESMNDKANEGFGEPGEPGDEDKIMEAVYDFMSAYRKTIRWKLSFSEINAIERFHRVIEEFYLIANSVLLCVDQLYEKLIIAKKTFDDYLAGKIELEDVEIDLNVGISIDMDGFNEALDCLEEENVSEEPSSDERESSEGNNESEDTIENNHEQQYEKDKNASLRLFHAYNKIK